MVSDVLASLGGRLYDPEFCDQHVGSEGTCAHDGATAPIRSLWRTVQHVVDQVLAEDPGRPAEAAGYRHSDQRAPFTHNPAELIPASPIRVGANKKQNARNAAFVA